MLSGVYFGDRASPVSTSALLVSELTKTDIYGNIRNMFRSAFVPTVISALLYFFIGGDNGNQEIAEGIDFSSYFYIGVPVLLPALAILLLGFFRVDVKKTMAFSIFLAAGCTFIFQHISITDLFQMAVWGFYPENEDLAKAVGRGGLVSMVQVSVIICISSSYAGIFHGTGMLDGIQQKIEHLSGKISSFCAILVVSVVTSMIACNQTLPSVLTHELCGHLVENRERLALALEDSVVVVSALVPWSIACAVPLDSVGAPVSSVPLAFYL